MKIRCAALVISLLAIFCACPPPTATTEPQIESFQNPCPHWYDKIIRVLTPPSSHFYFQNPTNPCPQRTIPQNAQGQGTAPTITSIAPATGPDTGGTAITITGTNFVAGAGITVGGTACTGITIGSSTTATCTTPAGTDGAASVVLTNPDGQTASGTFTYTCPSCFSLTVSVVGTGTAAGNGINCPGTCSVSLASGTAISLTASTAFTFSGWSGACTGTGTCSFTLTSNASVTATFTGGGGNCAGPGFTISSQEAATCAAYPGTLWQAANPADIMSHLRANSDAIVSNIFGGNIGNAYFTLWRGDSWAGGIGGGYGGAEWFYCSATAACPVYKVTGVVNTGTGSWSVLNKYFHLPAGKCMTGCSNCDQSMGVWDLSTDIDATSGGRYYAAYHYSGSPPCLNASCSCTTTTCANSTPACQLGSNSGFTYYADWDYPLNDPTPYAHTSGGDGSGEWSPHALTLRSAELVAGTISHALGVNTYCLYSPSGNGVSAGPVFPAIGTAIGCPYTDALRPLGGNHFFIDSSYNCNSSSVAGWQTGVCKALQTYGAYLHDTGAYDKRGVWIEPTEGPDAYLTAGLTEPAMQWFRGFTNYSGGSGSWTGQNGLLVVTDSSGKVTEVEAPFFNLPGALSHIHISDPCITIGKAGLSSWNGTNACH